MIENEKGTEIFRSGVKEKVKDFLKGKVFELDILTLRHFR